MTRFSKFLNRNPLLVCLLFLLILVIAGQLDSRAEDTANAYKRGVKIGIMAARVDKLTPEIQAQLVNICNQSWPATLEGAIARRRACGATPAARGGQ